VIVFVCTLAFVYVGAKAATGTSVTYTHDEWLAFCFVLCGMACAWANAVVLGVVAADRYARWVAVVCLCTALATMQTHEAAGAVFSTTVGRIVFAGNAALCLVPCAVYILSVW
jgi:hypothetical protein